MVSNIMNEVFQTSSPWMTFLIIINLILCLYRECQEVCVN